MATWPSGTKASTLNLDQGSDSPAQARSDLKQNTDNVNSIIDMFNIASPQNNQILKYSTANSRFELSADADLNTTYSISAETGTGGVNLRLTGSDASTDDVLLAAGSNITLTRTDANTITIASTASGGGASALDDLTDVVITAADTGDVLRYNGTNWVDVAETSLNVNSATTATTATNANNINIATTTGNTSDTTMSVVLVAAQTTGNQQPHIDGGLTYNASTNALSATTFVGALSGNASTATTATNATNINISNNNPTDTTMFPVLVGASTTGNQSPQIKAEGLRYDANARILGLGGEDISGILEINNGSGEYVRIQNSSSQSSNYTLTLPTTDGNSNEVLVTNGTGTLSWGTRLSSVSADTAPSLGGNLNVSTRSIVSTSTNNITLASANDINLTIEGSADKGIKIVEADVGDPGTPDLVTSIQPAGAANAFILFATDQIGIATTTGDIAIEPGGGTGNVNVVGNIVLDGDLDLVTGTVTTSTLDSDITITPNGAGVVIVDSDLDVVTGEITTSTLDGDLTLTANGTGQVVIDSEVTINADITDTPVDDTTVAAYLKITSNAGVYYLPLFQ